MLLDGSQIWITIQQKNYGKMDILTNTYEEGEELIKQYIRENIPEDEIDSNIIGEKMEILL